MGLESDPHERVYEVGCTPFFFFFEMEVYEIDEIFIYRLMNTIQTLNITSTSSICFENDQYTVLIVGFIAYPPIDMG